jgi:hypothetical protein
MRLNLETNRAAYGILPSLRSPGIEYAATVRTYGVSDNSQQKRRVAVSEKCSVWIAPGSRATLRERSRRPLCSTSVRIADDPLGEGAFGKRELWIVSRQTIYRCDGREDGRGCMPYT